MTKGDIILIPFPFTDLSGSKLRPAIVLFDSGIDIIVVFITTQIKWKETTDLEISPSAQNGIKRQSLIKTSKISTIDKSLVKGILGRLAKNEVSDLDNNLKIVLQIN